MVQGRIPTWKLIERTLYCDRAGLLDRFIELQKANMHPRRACTDLERRAFRLAQHELWTIAQRLVAHEKPELQWDIDILRAHIVTQLREALGTGTYSLKPTHKLRPILWQDIEITPEITCDPLLTGATALARDVRRLRKLLHQQRAIILALARSCQ